MSDGSLHILPFCLQFFPFSPPLCLGFDDTYCESIPWEGEEVKPAEYFSLVPFKTSHEEQLPRLVRGFPSARISTDSYPACPPSHLLCNQIFPLARAGLVSLAEGMDKVSTSTHSFFSLTHIVPTVTPVPKHTNRRCPTWRCFALLWQYPYV